MNINSKLRTELRGLPLLIAIPLFAALGGFVPSSQAQVAHFSGAVTTLGSGFDGPGGVAVDGSGNVFVADSGNNAVKELVAAGGYITVNILGSGFSRPGGVAVDGSGNVFVADSGNNAVKEIVAAGGYITVNILGSSFSFPTGVAVDGSGNIFVADNGNSAVKEIAAAGGYITVTTLASSFSFPTGVAVDGSGNVFVADTFNNAVKEIAAAGGYITVTALGSGFFHPAGMAVDGSGNVFVADFNNDAVKEIGTSNGNFGTVDVGVTSLRTFQVNFTFDTAGLLASTAVLTQGATNRDLTDAGGGTCSASHNYNAGDTCNINVNFKPTRPGVRYGAATLSDIAGAVIATAYVFGTGFGPQVNFSPGAQSTLGSSHLMSPVGMAVDGNGNLFVGDFNNNAVDEIVAAGGYITVKTLGGGLNGPRGLAVDGSGNVFVANYYDGSVKKIPPGCTSSTCVDTVVSGGFNGAQSVAVDGSGNVFVGPHNSEVKEIPLGCTSSSCVVSLGSGSPDTYFGDAAGVAVDGAGNVFVADQNNNAVKEIVAAGGYITVKTLGGGFYLPEGVAVDGSGNVFVADGGHELVKKIPPGCTSSTCVETLANGFYGPWGVAVDGSGNVFVADAGHSAVKKLDFADPPSLTFASTPVGSTSSDSPQTVTVTNIGNADLTFSIPPTGNNPSIAANFTFDSNGATACPLVSANSSTAGTLAAGASCLLPISFEPATGGTLNGSLALTDNHLNATAPNYAMQTISLSGIATQTDATSTAVSISPNPVAQGSPVTITATVTDTTSPGTSPTGSVTFTDTLGTTTVSLNGGNAVALSAGVAILPGVALTGLGTHTITATYAAVSGSIQGSSNAATVTVETIATTTTLAASNLTPAYGTSVMLTATISLFPTGPALGSVSFYNGATLLGTGTVSDSGVATLTTSSLPVAANSLTAVYSGNTNYATSTSQPITVTVSQAAPTITWPTPAAITYGNPLTVMQLNATASVPGTFAYSPGAGTVLGAGPHILSVAFMPTDATDYRTADAQVTLQVNKATPALAWAPAPLQLGYPLGAAQLDATASVAGTLYYTPPAGTVITAYSQTLSVVFTPYDTTDYTLANMSVPLTVTAGPLASVSPLSIDFGTVYLGTITAKNVAVTNMGTAPMTITDPLLSIVKGGNSNEFVAVNLCPKSLAVGKSCMIGIGFVAGPFYNPQTAMLSVVDNAAGSPQTVNLTATVIHPQAQLSAMSLNFVTQKMNTSSSAKPVVLTNTGATALTINSISIVGTNPLDFTETNDCPGSLAANASCTIGVTFKPTARGSRSGSVVFANNAQNSPQRISLSGAGS